MAEAKRDQNNVASILGVSSTDSSVTVPVQVNPITGRMKVEITGGTSPLTTKGDLYTFDTANARLPVGTDGQSLVADSAEVTGLKWATPAGGGDALTSNPLSQFAATTSAQFAGVISDETGTGSVVLATSPTLVTPVLGAATATTINGATIISGTLNGTVTGTNTGDQTTITGNAGTATALETARTIGGTSFDGTANIAIGALNSTNVGATTSSELAGVISDETGTGALVFGTSPTLVTPVLGTPTSGTLTNATGLPLTTGVTGTLLISNGGTGQTTKTEAFDALSPNTTKGDIIVNNGTDDIRLAVGANDTIIVADSGETSGLKYSDTITLKTLRLSEGLETNDQTGTTYTLVIGDAGKVITLTNAAAITLTIPTNASVAFAVGTIINFEQLGAGQVTFAGAGVTINSKDSNLSLTGQYSGAYLRKTATDTWLLLGDLA